MRSLIGELEKPTEAVAEEFWFWDGDFICFFDMLLVGQALFRVTTNITTIRTLFKLHLWASGQKSNQLAQHSYVKKYFTSNDPHHGISSDIFSDILSGISSDIFSGILSGISSDILSGISSDILSGISSDILSGWGPAVPTGIWSSRWRSGCAHWDLELAVEVRLCPLGSGARGGGPAVPTGIWTARTRRRVRRRRRQWRRGGGEQFS